jgi:hypothetical protein
MVRLNFFVAVGASMVLAGAFMAIVGAFSAGLYGLIGAIGIFGPLLPSFLSIGLGFAMIGIGTRPKGFAQRKGSKARHQKS